MKELEGQTEPQEQEANTSKTRNPPASETPLHEDTNSQGESETSNLEGIVSESNEDEADWDVPLLWSGNVFNFPDNDEESSRPSPDREGHQQGHSDLPEQ